MGAQAVRLSNVDIDKALENKDFEVLFQPIFDLGNGALARMESFVRWRHPSLGVLPPGAFISFFESQGRMSELTRYVLGEALTDYMNWRGPFAPGFSLNLALTDLADEAFPQHFKKLLRDRDFPADLVTLECPMPLVEAEMEMAAAQYARLKETGARLAIEVRGRANEFLRQIDPFPFDEIKTGGASILRFARTVRGPGLSAISDLLDIATKANAAITAVGVEDQASLAALRGLGFTAAQGNHLANVGELKAFMPSRVNEVRQLLDLTPLGPDDLAALFRTAAPEPKAASEEDTAASEDAMIERLNERAASHAPAEEEIAEASSATDAGDDDKRAKAREKAKALALAKRAKAREMRKEAAIKRAKAKAAQSQQPEEFPEESPAPLAARAMQDRILEEFAGSPSGAASAKAPAAQKQETLPLQPIEPAAERKAAAPKPKPAGGDIKPGPVIDSEFTPIAKTNPVNEPASDTMSAGASRAEPRQADEAVRLKIRSVSGHFWPVVRIGGIAKDAHMVALGEAAAAQAEAAPVSSPSAPAAEPVVQGDLQNDYGADEQPVAKAPQPRRRKNFLQRKYNVVPTHFWPKSWKRQYRRWQAGQAEAKPARETQAAE